MRVLFWFLAVVIFVPLALSIARGMAYDGSWRDAPRHSSGLAPDPLKTPEAIVQIYSARAFNWRGYVATHPWIIVKRRGAARFTRYEVVGWGGGQALKVNYALPDGMWFGAEPSIMAEYRGAGVERMIDRVEAAIRTYPFKDQYRSWPGPNSNTFLAHVAREVPELRLDIPANAIGKDYRAWDEPVALAPSGTGVQLSLLGLAGVTLGIEEGVEFNVLGLNLGIDILRPALRVPGLGRIGFPEDVARQPETVVD
ncbi:DUF3750 domain-containing protein [Dongia sp.]|uniref:DUF3750 domain-containing protein n=1 Tax=Dongia sp. TaxID=1977262 RepID=UPI0035AE50E0